MSKVAVFEQPLNERVRNFLRFQFLFRRLDHHLNRSSAWDTHAALSTLLEIVNLTSRFDIKSEVMKELERQNTAFQQFVDDPGVDDRRLASVMARQKDFIDALHGQKGQIAHLAAQNEFLGAVRQRAAVSGSTCSMDLPIYQFWLNTPIEKRREEISAWVEPMQTVRAAVELTLEAIRKSSSATEQLAARGFYQQNLNLARPLQLVKVSFRERLDLFPEISAGKHRFTIRFLEHVSVNKRPEQTQDDVAFLLTCCAI
ncbi:MAG: cell division protein ZapD [Gammaproteobacteria bacterium]|nr:cell division protein ZapD [Gammaproteobacteria bacterium]